MPSAKRSGMIRNLWWILVSAVLLVLIAASFQISRALKSTPIAPSPSPSPVIAQSIDGIYKGNLPCADCTGIIETLILAKDGSYILEDLYQGKSAKPFRSQGKWEKDTSGILKLNPEDASEASFFQINANGNLQMLDSNMQAIDSPFNQTLAKQN